MSGARQPWLPYKPADAELRADVRCDRCGKLTGYVFHHSGTDLELVELFAIKMLRDASRPDEPYSMSGVGQRHRVDELAGAELDCGHCGSTLRMPVDAGERAKRHPRRQTIRATR